LPARSFLAAATHAPWPGIWHLNHCFCGGASSSFTPGTRSESEMRAPSTVRPWVFTAAGVYAFRARAPARAPASHVVLDENAGARDQSDQTPMSRAGSPEQLFRCSGRRGFLVGAVQPLCCVRSCAHGAPVGLGGGGRRRRLCRRAEDHGARWRSVPSRNEASNLMKSLQVRHTPASSRIMSSYHSS